MRKVAGKVLESMRRKHPTLGLTPVGSLYGFFHNGKLSVISSGEVHPGMPWEHVSVSLVDRCPTWNEMSFVKDLFWLPTETVIQIHPPKLQHINYHEFCLHLWRNVNQQIILPPDWTIA